LYALTYPERIESHMRFSVSDLRHLDFAPPDLKKFPCLRLAYEAAEAGGAKTVALNAADEMAVASFLEGEIRFDQIPLVIEEVLAETNSGALASIHGVLEADALARKAARERIALIKKTERPRATSFV
jgi:1-deoxy-D-xylulose-5-phosphate reductoisomerase